MQNIRQDNLRVSEFSFVLDVEKSVGGSEPEVAPEWGYRVSCAAEPSVFDDRVTRIGVPQGCTRSPLQAPLQRAQPITPFSYAPAGSSSQRVSFDHGKQTPHSTPPSLFFNTPNPPDMHLHTNCFCRFACPDIQLAGGPSRKSLASVGNLQLSGTCICQLHSHKRQVGGDGR